MKNEFFPHPVSGTSIVVVIWNFVRECGPDIHVPWIFAFRFFFFGPKPGNIFSSSRRVSGFRISNSFAGERVLSFPSECFSLIWFSGMRALVAKLFSFDVRNVYFYHRKIFTFENILSTFYINYKLITFNSYFCAQEEIC